MIQIKVIPSARAHGITDIEIRAVVSFYLVRVALVARVTGAQPFIFIAPVGDDEPWIEVIADLHDPEVAVVFHATMLRPTVVTNLDLGELIDPIYSSQRR